jgi:hypothetical protein
LAHPDSALSDWNNSEIGEPRRISSRAIVTLIFLETLYDTNS